MTRPQSLPLVYYEAAVLDHPIGEHDAGEVFSEYLRRIAELAAARAHAQPPVGPLVKQWPDPSEVRLPYADK